MKPTIYHSPQWREVLSATYRYRDYSYGYEDNTGIIAPLMIVNNYILRKKLLVALPFSDEAGPILSNNDKSPLKYYFDYLDNVLKENKLDYIEIKGINRNLVNEAINHGFVECFENYTFRVDLSMTEEAITKDYSQNVKRNLRKKTNIEVVTNGDELIDKFYKLHLLTMKRLGTPPHKRSFFLNLIRYLGDNVVFLYALLNSKIIASIVLLLDESLFCARYIAGASLIEYKHLNANTFLFDEAIGHSKKQGYQYFDLGVSRPNTGIWQFKRKWTAMKPVKVYYMIKGKEDSYIDPRQTNIVKYSNIWKKWVPLPIANTIGPSIRAQLGK